ncbi:hypothetical protein [Rhodococcus sp. W8901]|uniref:hypothetical protein n=1 Tax=Rhodococcus sp. W8901 TaxID=2742603 RepID=UPI001581C727|nr:hypothetical protein [Rhodococcus sp. W8901]QKT13111.1 hypothetical protein HUN07_22425 [Rhodococcus sp. W8901]
MATTVAVTVPSTLAETGVKASLSAAVSLAAGGILPVTVGTVLGSLELPSFGSLQWPFGS